MGARSSGLGRSGRAFTIQNADINITPFVDIMLVMLIIFMVAAPLATVSIKLDLPPPVIDAGPREPVYVTLLETGGLMIGDQPSSPATLVNDLCARIGGGNCTDERIFLRAEAEVDYRAFMAVMNHLHAESFPQIGLLNEDIK